MKKARTSKRTEEESRREKKKPKVFLGWLIT